MSLSLAGCGSLRLRPPRQPLGAGQTSATAPLADEAECDSLDNKALGWTATAVVAGVLGGGGGVSSLFTENTPRYVTGGIGVGLAALTALSSFLSTQYSARYAQRCTVNTGGR